MHDISATAFVVNVSRSMRVDISRDTYAHLWVTEEARQLWDRLAREVYPYDQISSSLRNRFYLEQLTKVINTNQKPAFVNIAAGFSNYPFLVDASCRCAEVDFGHIIAYKEERLNQWQQTGVLPRREVERLGADLTSDADRERLSQSLETWWGGPSFVMMEGLTYYLSPQVLSDLLRRIAERQTRGSVLAFEYWTPDADDYPVYRRLESYLAEGFGEKGQHYQLLDSQFLHGIAGYDVVETSDIAAQEALYSDTRSLQDRNNRLPIHFAVLRKR
jgi:O-methyltransferase involved in polyketide biosynthesis